MITARNRIARYLDHPAFCLRCPAWSDGVQDDCWNNAPGRGHWCPKCAGSLADAYERYPLLAAPSPEPQRLSWWRRWWLWVQVNL